jgi:hypothetical protein
MGGYSDGSNTWPDALTPDGLTNFDKVGKYFGERVEGNVAGVTCATNGQGRMVFEFDAVDTAVAEIKSLTIPDGFAQITSVLVEVEGAFDAGTVDVNLDGTTVLTGDVALDTAGMIPGTLSTTPSDLTIAADLEVTIETTGITGTDGNAKVIVEFTRV